ncbi:hypothetical protein [Borrelia miyamotoi]|uniref:hypothetical protein n=1 Tax=Borrelia miyamotoi TaxID=47466 RepID=UPI0031FE6E7F
MGGGKRVLFYILIYNRRLKGIEIVAIALVVCVPKVGICAFKGILAEILENNYYESRLKSESL